MQAGSAFSLISGRANYRQDPGTSLAEAPCDVTVELGTWISEAALWMQWVHIGRLTAQRPCGFLVVAAERIPEVLANYPVVGHIVRTYAQNYHWRVVTAEPPHAQWPTDLMVEFTDISDLLFADYGLDLLRASLQAGLVMSPEHVAALEGELLDHKCALSETVTGELERTVFVLALQLSDSQGRLLAQLGKWRSKDEDVRPLCQLPGLKRLPNESPHDALSRLFAQGIGALASCVDLHHREHETEVKASQTYGIKSLYRRTVQFASVRANVKLPEFPVVRPAQRSSFATKSWPMSEDGPIRASFITKGRQSFSSVTTADRAKRLASDIEVFAVNADNLVLLYSWLKPAYFDTLRGARGEPILKQIFAESALDADLWWRPEELVRHSDGSVASLSLTL